MDLSLLQAAWNGDVDHLLKQVHSNPSVLHTLALNGGENPLHVACLAGHLNFAATIVKLQPEFTRELNQHGFSPLHIAASCGHIEIVEELLQVNRDLCLLEGEDGKIPLHVAVAKGNVEVMKLLLSHSDSINCITARGETVLHLAVKCNQFKVFKLLIQHLKQISKEHLLNFKDFNGNTILHLAVYKKQYQVVNLILNRGVISKEKIKLNSLNNNGLTPLDMLLMFQSEAGDREIHEILTQTGALKAENLGDLAYTQEDRPNLHDTRVHEGTIISLIDYFRYNRLNDTPSEVRNTLLVIVILVAATTFQYALSPLGGTWQDDYVPATSNAKPHTAGQPIMLTDPIFYIMFIFGNSLGFYTSLIMIHTLTKDFPLRMGVNILVLTLSASYAAGMMGIIKHRSVVLGQLYLQQKSTHGSFLPPPQPT